MSRVVSSALSKMTHEILGTVPFGIAVGIPTFDNLLMGSEHHGTKSKILLGEAGDLGLQCKHLARFTHPPSELIDNSLFGLQEELDVLLIDMMKPLG
jgi:hypothetical protein